MLKTHWISLALALMVGGALAGMEYQRNAVYVDRRVHSTAKISTLAETMQRLEWAALDGRFKIRGARQPHPDVVIIGIDEGSLEEVGEWPWPRSIHARLIDVLKKEPPKALLFDILFLEPFTAHLEGDKALIRATKENPWVVHSMFLNVSDSGVQGGKLPMKALAEAAGRIGSVNAFPDDDGVLRSAPPWIKLDDVEVPLLSLEGAALYGGLTPAQVVDRMPLDGRGELLVQYAGPEHSFRYLPYSDVLRGQVSAEAWRNKVVLVGSRATGTYDHYPTPLSKNMPGVEFHANIIDNLISRSALRYRGGAWTTGIILGLCLFSGILFARVKPLSGAVGVLLSGALYFGVTQVLFTKQFIVLDLAGPEMALGLSYLVIVIYRFFAEEREKRWVKAAFGQYVSPKVLDVLMANPEGLHLGGERHDMTVFFSDVAGFTSISERMTPDALVVLLNRYLSAMTEVVFKYDGYLNKYMGDGIMAFWNAPVKQADHAERACRCALESRTALETLNRELVSQGFVPLAARIGINSGTMAVGNMGSRQKSDYTVMGDNVNLASRLEGANKAYGSSIMISEFTYEMVQDKFEARYLDRLRVPGKAKPVRTYELLAEKGALTADWQKAMGIYHEAILAYAERDFEKARNKFLEVQHILPQDKPSAVYVARCEAFLAHPPEKDWDGVFEVKSK